MKTLENTTPGQQAPGFEQRHLDRALGSAALEALHPSPETLADLQRVVAGELTGGEYMQRLKARHGYGLQR